MMKNVDMERVVIPVGQIANAQKALQEHVKVLYKDAKWLKKHDCPSISILFFILCMEEIAKFYVMDECKGENRDVTKKDMKPLYGHKGKLQIFLQNTSGLRDGLKRAESLPSDVLDYGQIAEKLESMKERAVYFEHKNGFTITLESILGPKQVSNIAVLLQTALTQGISVMNMHLNSKPVLNKKQLFAQTEVKFQYVLRRVMANAQSLQVGNVLETDIAIPKEDFDIALNSLEDHIDVLSTIAITLHKKKHPEASIFLSVICFEESTKHYIIAKCRRKQCDVSNKLLRDLEKHNMKLSAFFNDVEDSRDERNRSKNSTEKTEYNVIHPQAFLKLDGVKQLAVYFNYLDNTTFSLRGISGHRMSSLSYFLCRVIPGMASWMIMSDGDSDNPYRRHNRNPAYYERYNLMVAFLSNPKNTVFKNGTYYIMGLFDYLNDALRNYNVSQCRTQLAKICKHIKD